VCAAACRVTHAFQGFNKISDLGASSLADALKRNTCLTQLDLVSGGFGRGGDVDVVMCTLRHVVCCWAAERVRV
jgi:hypothetical protein